VDIDLLIRLLMGVEALGAVGIDNWRFRYLPLTLLLLGYLLLGYPCCLFYDFDLSYYPPRVMVMNLNAVYMNSISLSLQ